jgi:hypothetical protein
MTYTRAKLIIWNPASYDRALVRAAVAFILGSLSASDEDVGRAMGIA